MAAMILCVLVMLALCVLKLVKRTDYRRESVLFTNFNTHNASMKITLTNTAKMKRTRRSISTIPKLTNPSGFSLITKRRFITS